jgi:hypothetical protein
LLSLHTRTDTTLFARRRREGRLREPVSVRILRKQCGERHQNLVVLRDKTTVMWDRYDSRSSDGRDRDDLGGRSRGSRGAASDPDLGADRDPRDVFTRDLDLPRGRERRPVRERDRVYEINGAESRMLATIGAFRVVAERDLHDGRDDTRKAQRHLEREGLLRTSPLSSDDRAVVLTDRGQDLLEANRHDRQERSWEPRQSFCAGLRKPRELTH